MSTRPTFILTLTDAGDDGVPSIIRLRRLLKAALRVFKFRAVEVREDRQAQEMAADQLRADAP